MANLPKSPTKLLKVNTRLYESDTREIKRRAKAKGIRWQVELRNFLHESLQRVGVIK